MFIARIVLANSEANVTSPKILVLSSSPRLRFRASNRFSHAIATKISSESATWLRVFRNSSRIQFAKHLVAARKTFFQFSFHR